MAAADAWFMCRVGFVETARAVGLVAGVGGVQQFEAEWPSFGVIELDQPLASQAADLAHSTDLRSLDAIHLASALLLPGEDLAIATYDRRLHASADARGLYVVPEALA
jgi:predicted nucleic acid-binding protein